MFVVCTSFAATPRSFRTFWSAAIFSLLAESASRAVAAWVTTPTLMSATFGGAEILP